MKLVLLEKLNECGMKSGILFLQYLCLQLRIEYFVVVMIMSLPELYKKHQTVVSALLFRIPDYWLFVLKLIFLFFIFFILLNQSKCKALI